MQTGTIRTIGVVLIAAGVVSWVFWFFVTFLFAGTFNIGVFEFDYHRCRFDQTPGCQLIAKAPEYGLVLIAIGALLYGSARTRKRRVGPKEASSQVPPSQMG